MIPASTEGATNRTVAERVSASPQAVSKWRRRFLERGVSGLHDELSPRPSPQLRRQEVAQVINRVLQQKPVNAENWMMRLMVAAKSVSKNSAKCWFSLCWIKPHLAQIFEVSNDPFFIEKVRDIEGPSLHPPDYALVLCVDERSQIQPLDRTQPTRPLGLGYVQPYTHDYIRKGTITLLDALDVATGRVIAQCKKRHRHQDVWEFVERDLRIGMEGWQKIPIPSASTLQ